MIKPILATICLSLFLSFAQAQTVTGTLTDLSSVLGQTVLVDDGITISSPGIITNATVRIDGVTIPGDLLSMDDLTIPSGGFSTFNAATGRLTITGSGTAAEWETALRTVAFSSNSIIGGTRVIVFTIGSAIYNFYNNHYYEYVENSLSWTNAKAAAELKTLYGMPGYLATIADDNENDFIASKLKADGWIGASDDYLQINAATGATTYANQGAAEGNWYWVTGPEKGTLFSTGNNSPVTVTYAHWNSGEPNDWAGEHYGQIYSSGGFWNDLNNFNTLGYVVEYGGTGSDPVLDLEHSRNLILADPTLTGNGAASSGFRSNNQEYPVEPLIQFNNIGDVTDVTVSIAEGFADNDVLDFDAGLLPPGVSGSYDAFRGVLNFTGTASGTDWNILLQSLIFKTTSPSLVNRKITFTPGNLPASTDGHFFVLSAYTPNFLEQTYYFDWYQPELASYMGLRGYLVNINSEAENNFLLKKIASDFWLPLSDSYWMIDDATGNHIHSDQSETEGQFYWLLGPGTGTLVSSGNAPSMTPEVGQYNNWQTNEPDNNGYEGQASFFNAVDGKWYDESLYDDFDYFYKPVVIEYGGSVGDPVYNLFFAKTMVNLATLPVTLSKFEVRKDNLTAVADWSTESEVDYSYFHLERSTNNRQFSPIGKVFGRGNNQGVQNYRFVDMRPVIGNNYYRLKLVNEDSSFSYSLTRKVEFLNTKANKVYPTIVSQDLHVELANPVNSNCTIINEAGILVRRITQVSSSFTIPVQSLPKGAYILSIINAAGEKENWKFIRQ